MNIRVVAFLLVLSPGLTNVGTSVKKPDASPPVPETVVATFHVKDGKDAEFLDLYRKAWSTYKRFGMVLDEPHLLMKSTEDGKPCFYEILRWKSGEEPDHAPGAVKDLWTQMQAICEKRLGHASGIEGFEVKVLGAEITAVADLASLSNTDTETVLSTFRVKEGKQNDFAAVEAKAWSIYRKLGMTLPKPHIILQGTEQETGKPLFICVLTWKDHDAPDRAPEEVKAVWREMESLCEKRNLHRGIEFQEVRVIDSM